MSGDMKNQEKVVQAEPADLLHSEVLDSDLLMNDAIDGENKEHQMGLWAAVKAYPWACLWAFTMCFTIVSSPD